MEQLGEGAPAGRGRGESQGVALGASLAVDAPDADDEIQVVAVEPVVPHGQKRKRSYIAAPGGGEVFCDTYIPRE